MSLQYDIWPIISNIAFLIPALYLLNARLYLNAFINVKVFLFSTLYHLCEIGVCLINFEFHQTLDYFFAFICVGLMLVHFVDVKSDKLIAMLQVIVISFSAIIVTYDHTNETYFLIACSPLIPLALYHFMINYVKFLKSEGQFKHCCNSKLAEFLFKNRKYEFHPIRFLFFVIGFLIFLTGFLCQYFSSERRWIFHSLWHVCVALAQIPMYAFYDNSSLLTRCCFIKQKKVFVPVDAIIE